MHRIRRNPESRQTLPPSRGVERRWPRAGSFRARQRPSARRLGAAAVEFAVVLPLLVILLLGGADLGRCFYTTIAVSNAVRSAGQYGSMNMYDPVSPGAWTTGVQQAAINELSGSTQLDTTRLTITTSVTTEADGARRFSVQATYPFTTFVHWTIFPSTYTVTETLVMRIVR